MKVCVAWNRATGGPLKALGAAISPMTAIASSSGAKIADTHRRYRELAALLLNRSWSARQTYGSLTSKKVHDASPPRTRRWARTIRQGCWFMHVLLGCIDSSKLSSLVGAIALLHAADFSV